MPTSTGGRLVVPEEFLAEISDGGHLTSRWASSLPDLFVHYAATWHLDLDIGSPRFGSNALVVLGDRRGEPCALKAGRPDNSLAPEVDALRVWDGRGAVRLLQASSKDNVVLLEGLEPDRSLEGVPLGEAAEVIGRITRQLTVAAPEGFRGALDFGDVVSGQLSRAEPDKPVPSDWLRLATRLCSELAREASQVLVPSDLHGGNVLAGSREPWLAIDPRPVVGAPELALGDLLLWHLPLDADHKDVVYLLETMVNAGDFDPRTAREWTIVRAVSRWVWCSDADADLPSDARCSICAPRCTTILEALT